MGNTTSMLSSCLEQSGFCAFCCEIDTTIRSRGPGLEPQQVPWGAQDIYLGRKSELLTRSSRCQSCRALISCAEQERARLSESPTPMFNGDYDFSAHFKDQNPILLVAFGSLPSESACVSKRRQRMKQLGILSLFSTDHDTPEGLTAWLAGTPRLFDPQLCDPSIIREWLQHCQCTHGDRCLRPASWLLQSKISRNFIDVGLECIVTPVDVVPFVALSYVWGKVETLQALESNIDDLKRPGSLSALSSHVVPRTIRDAMTLCALTGQRYLWVDRVCIVQDDYKTKQQHLQAMAETYAKAEFTIVAADGSDADHGLSGLGQGTEERQRHLIPFPSKSLIRGTTWAFGNSFSSDTVWSSRAWTFQEHVFSRRLLYIDKFVNWVCASARWAEALSPSPFVSQPGTTTQDSHVPGGKLFVIDWPSLTGYASMVEQYNVRQLTYDSDAANAFTGLLTQMCEGFPAGFFGGIPEFYFTICLLWQPQKGLRPRFDQPGASFLPTWSWLGWSGALDLQMWTCNTDTELPPAPYEVTISPLVEWFKAPDRQRNSRIDDSYITVRKHFLENAALPPSGWQKHDGGPDSYNNPYYTYHAREHMGRTRKFRYPVPPSQRYRDINAVDSSSRYLYANVQKAFFIFGAPESQRPEREDDGGYATIELPLYTPSSTWAGFIRVNVYANEPLPIGERCEVIRIAKGSLPVKDDDLARIGLNMEDRMRFRTANSPGIYRSHPFIQCTKRKELEGESQFDFYFVLWIRWDGDTACRQALGVVWERAWEQVAPEEVDIKLG
ncbi:heterokaryon incompatibility protein-domain-containing protein [Hypoxylon argillaceum]|nr:heterokaryon incompatibility protein-domain-containing protein [Hypoxylon argillaceum]KAI1148310.1 heterokaryon incompatibility protein-domain-containing protein [Nemania diffusa]